MGWLIFGIGLLVVGAYSMALCIGANKNNKNNTKSEPYRCDDYSMI